MATPETARGSYGKQSSESMSPGEGQVVPDDTFGVVSVLYHALQGSEKIQQYAEDARESGDEDLIEFFDDCIQKQDEMARRARALLIERLIDEDDYEEGDERTETD
jgi:hypothetical protein